MELELRVVLLVLWRVSVTELLDAVLRGDATAVPCDAIEDWWPRMLAAERGFDRSIDRAVAGGFAADRLGWAFVAGYQQALRALDPALSPETPAALAATEEGGGHPRAMATRFIRDPDGGGTLAGTKRFVTLGPFARTVLVVASTGADADGRNRLVVVRVQGEAAGIRWSPLPTMPFAPEIVHASATFEDVPVAAADVLPGDGYDRYLKPFRTLEDLHVAAGALGHLLAVAKRNGWSDGYRAELATAVLTVRALAENPPVDPATHVALGGFFAALHRLADQATERWQTDTSPEGERWLRDRRLLDVASTVRAKRLEAAWRAIDGRAPVHR